MSDFDYKEFKEEVRTRLRKLDNPRLSVAFAVRMAILALPFLADRAEEKGFLWYWQKDDREKYLLAACRALQAVFLYFLDPNSVTAGIARVAVHETKTDTIVTVHKTGRDAIVAHYGNIVFCAAVAADADAANTAAADAADAAADAANSAAANAGDMIIFIRQELDCLKANSDALTYCVRPYPPLSGLTLLKDMLLTYLRKLPEFDYWADWLQDRYEGKPIDPGLLRKSVLLPKEIQAQSPTKINTYLKSLYTSESMQPLNRVRVIFIGSGETGKTSLIRTLRGQRVVQGQEAMTPGIDINRVKVKDIKADLWDFGGQVMAHATHQFFLRERCLYVLVLHARPQLDPNEEARYWLEHVRAFGKDAPVLVVGNKADVMQVNLNRNELQDKYRNIQGFYDISCTQAKGAYQSHFKKFKQDFVRQLKNLEICQVLLPPAHLQVLEALETISPRESFLTQKAFNELCTRHDVPAAGGLDKDWLLDLFDKLGVIVYFPDIAYLDDFILNPRWLTYGVYTLLYSKEVERQAGQIAENAVSAILQAEKVQDNMGNTLSYQDKAHWITGSMEAFKICYKVGSGADTQLMIPTKLADSRPLVDFERNGSLAFDFDCEGFLPRHLIASFIVKHHTDIDRYVWQSGVQLKNSAFGATALAESDQHNRRFSLWIKGEQAARYFAVLYATVKEMLNKMPKLPVQEFVRLPGSEDELNPSRRASFRQLLAFEQRGTTDEYIADDGTVYSVTGLLKIMPKELRREQNVIIHNHNINQVMTMQQQNQNQEQTPNQVENKQMYQPQNWEKIIGYLTGAGFIGLIMYLLVRNEAFADPNLAVMARILLSVCAGLFTATVPGFLHIDFSAKGWVIRAGGALAMAVLTYMWTPTVLE
ncbi:MAG: hypothetical protein GY862_38835 [Gammaproteobacteria bacterium]|nr:hypothetical protein [Gammaproteobacteria bacterium]